MRACPTCHSEYADDVGVCPRDGQALVAAPAVAAGPPVTTAAGAMAPAQGPAMAATAGPPAMTAAARALAPSSTVTGATAAVPAPMPATTSGETFDSLVGATLAGRYLIIRRIGEGGMGAVYEAKHTIIGKRVAVKVLLEKFLTKSDFVARLLQEARLASAIGHEHIVDVTDFGTTDDGRAFVAMEFLEGESLAQLVMREAPLPVERSLRITRQVASALGAAHAKGIVHRDVKPENVYLIRRGDADFVKVVDFGISKAVKQGQGDDTPDYRLTHTGLLLGTPLYMSPEQARGDEDLDERVDVWAMGVLMYECLTGEVPFRANNYLGIISQVLTHTALPPSKLRPELGIPEAVEAVVMHAMEKDRNRRYASMAEVEQDLERLLAGDQNVGAGAGVQRATVPPPIGPARGRLWVWGAAVAALVGGVAMVLARPEGDARPVGAGPAPLGAADARALERPRSEGAPAVRVGGPTPVVRRPAAGGAADDGSSVVRSETAGAARLSGTAAPGATPGGTGAATAVGGVVTSAAHPTDGSQKVRASRSNPRPGSRRDPVDASRSGTGEKPPARAAEERRPVKPTNPVIRGALPSRSGEGYPDN